MSGIKKKDIYDGGNPFEPVINGLKEVLTLQNTLIENGKKMAEETEKRLKSVTKFDAKGLKKYNTETEKAKKLITDQSALEKERSNTQKQLNTVLAKNLAINEKRAKTLQKGKLQLQERQRDLKEQIKLERQSGDSVNAQEIKLRRLKREYKSLSDTQRKELLPTIQKLDKQVKKLNSDIGDSYQNVGAYSKAFQGLKGVIAKGLGFLGITAGIQGLKRAFTSIITTQKDFELKISTLSAIARPAANELSELKAQAELLGRTTQRSASDVASLQIELSKLGFDPQQIKDSTEGILQLSIATGEDLAKSASVAAGVLNAFQKDASETGAVVDVFAKAFSSSALDLEKFKNAIGPVAPIANQAGVSLEKVTATLGILTDRNIDASTSGTALRNIYLTLAEKGLELDEALGMIRDSSDANAKALELFGKRGAAVATIIANSTPQIDKLTTSLENSEGAAAAAAKTLSDNLEGDVLAAKSALEGLQITVGEKLNPNLRFLTQEMTKVLGNITEFIAGSQAASKSIVEESEDVLRLTTVIQNNNSTRAEQELALTELNKIAPEVAKNVDLEADNYVLLNEQLDTYLDNVIKRIALASLEEEQQKALAKVAALRVSQATALTRANTELKKVNDELRVDDGAIQDNIPKTIQLLNEEVNAQKEAGEAGRRYTDSKGFVIDSRTKEQKQLQLLVDLYSNYLNSQDKINKINEKAIDPLNEQIRVLRELLTTTEETATGIQTTAETTIENIVQLSKIGEKFYSAAEKQGRDFWGKLAAELEAFFNNLTKTTATETEAIQKSLEDGLGKSSKSLLEKSKRDFKAITELTFLNSKQLLADEITREEERRAQLLLNQELTEAERQLIIKQSEDEITRLKQSEDDKRKQNTINNLSLTAEAFGAFNNTLSALQEIQLANAEGNAKKQKDIQKKYANIQFALTTGQIIADTAAGIARQYKDLPAPLAAATSILIGINGAAQLGLAEAERRRVQSLGTGGLITDTGIIKGDSHSAKSGGEWLGNQVKVERGEKIAVFNKNVSRSKGAEIEEFYRHINNGTPLSPETLNIPLSVTPNKSDDMIYLKAIARNTSRNKIIKDMGPYLLIEDMDGNIRKEFKN